MAILTDELGDVQGFKKEIEQSSMSLVLDTLQKHHYNYPQKSTIRELTSNALDAIMERDIATNILAGKVRKEDYYIERNDPMYIDSNFDANYYNPLWLWGGLCGMYQKGSEATRNELFNRRPDKAYIIYQDGGDQEKDKLIIEDFGVGLGGKRLEGYFRMMYSTKRNTKHVLGKWGVGAKAGLSTMPFYTMITRYNGREYAFNVYSHDVLSITPGLDMATGKPNGVHVFSNDARIYYRQTTLPNGTRIEIDSKKHYKQLYIDAVKSQLLYFDNIVFQLKNLAGATDTIDIKAKILYEDEHIVLSDNTQYSKPHLLISKVNYGYVDFRELELQDIQGNIGIKVAAEQVSVTPSRESVIWDDMTRKTVMESFDKVTHLAETMISKQLQVDDFLEWIKACAEISSKYASSDSILGRLAKVVDLGNAKIRYSKDSSIIYGAQLLQGLSVRLCELETVRVGSNVVYKVKRSNISPGQMALGIPTVVQRSRSLFGKDKYMLQELYPDGFISFLIPFEGADDTESDAVTPAMQFALEHWYKCKLGEVKPDKYQEALDSLVVHMNKVSGYILKSKGFIEYTDIVIPEGFNQSSEVTEEEAEAQTVEGKAAKGARAKLIREKGIIPVFTPRATNSSYVTDGEKYGTKLFDWQKIELPVADIDKWDEEEVFYGTEKVLEIDDDGKPVIEAELLQLAAFITRPQATLTPRFNHHPNGSQAALLAANNKEVNTPWPDKQYGVIEMHLDRCNHFFDNGQHKPRVKLIKVAQERRKFFLDFKPIQRFFLDIKGKTLTMSNALIRWNTARVMHEGIHKLEFLENFDVFHGAHAKAYRGLVSYIRNYYRELKEHSVNERYYSLRDKGYDQLVMHCNKLTQFQLLVRTLKDKPEAIAQAAKELFAPETEITDGCAIDTAFYDTYMELLDYAVPIGTLLNEVGILTGIDHCSISEELEQEIRSYLASKNVHTQ